MSKYKNLGFDPKEIKELEAECKAENSNFVFCEDEEENIMEDSEEFAHVQFVGKHNDEPVIYDAIFYTLRLHHSSMVYERAVNEVKKTFPKYLAYEERDDNYEIDPEIEEEAELMITEIIETLEEDEEVKVSEHIEIDTEFEYGIGIEVSLNVEKITEDVIEDFVKKFNSNTLKLDNTLYSFVTEDEE